MRFTSTRLVAVSLLAVLCFSPSFATESLTDDDKARFLETICQEAPREDRCLSSGRLVLGLSINWIVFEGCSAAGEVEAMAACFDGAYLLAAELTGDQEFQSQYRHCHRFQGDHNEDAIVRCYREGFKYTTHTLKTYHSEETEPAPE
ncbi:MAG: hypothetical protein OXC69_00340 [Candidatus Tectomicrobia bacterium]|nr:hypothetical protein [Candidatus Tectomicrobia bacterium]